MYPDNNYTYLHFIYIIGGLYEPHKIKSSWKRYLYIFYNIFMITSCMIYFYPSQIAYLDQTMDDLYKFLNSIGLLVTETIGIQKWLMMWRNIPKFHRIQRKLDSIKYRYEDYGDFKPGAKIFTCRKYARAACLTFGILGYFVPITMNSNFFDDLPRYGNATCREILPYHTYIPFRIDTYQRCIVAFVFQSYPVTFFVAPIIACDLTFSVIAIFACGNFINIRDAFKTMRGRCLARLGLPHDYKVLRDSENPLLEREMAKEARKLCIHLQEHIAIVDEMEAMCKYVVLGQAFVALFSIVTSLYILSEEMQLSSMMIAQVHYCTSMIVQLSSYCIVGDAITRFSSDVSNGIYSSDWLPCTESVKRMLIINLIRLQKPINFTIGKFSPLKLSTILQILKGSYSYFTFLQRT